MSANVLKEKGALYGFPASSALGRAVARGSTETRVTAATFKARCLALISEVQASGRPLVITKHGRPVARLLPYEAPAGDDVFGCLAGKYALEGDLVAPPVGARDWDAVAEWDALVAQLPGDAAKRSRGKKAARSRRRA